MRISFIVTIIGFLFSAPTFACKCGKFSNPDELFEKSDLVFVGSKLLGQKANAESLELYFTIHRFAKGDQSTFGSNQIKIKFQEDVNIMCRGYQDKMSYLVFAVKNKQGAYSFLTDCYNDTIPANGPSYEYRGKKITDFKFFKVNVTSAFNGTSPRYAIDLTENEAKELATQHLFQNAEFRKVHINEFEMWKAISAERKQDDRKQTFWRVQIAYTPARAKGEFYFIDFYNSLYASFHILPGK